MGTALAILVMVLSGAYLAGRLYRISPRLLLVFIVALVASVVIHFGSFK